MIPKSQTLLKQDVFRYPSQPPESPSPLPAIETAEPHQEAYSDEMEPNARYTRSSLPRRTRPPPRWASLFEHYLAASFMMITSSMVSTFWIDNPFPFCSRYWVVLGNTDECYWRPNAFMMLAACTGYCLAAAWWYNQHRRWPHQMATIALAVLGGILLSLVLKADLEHILRNTLTWSIFSGLMVSAIMDRRKTHRAVSSRV